MGFIFTMERLNHKFHFIFLLAGVVVSLIMLSSGIDHVFNSKEAKKGRLEVQTYRYRSGFGYKILLEEKVLIQQNHIPSLETNQSFCSRGQAERVASFVVSKLERGANPAISYSELKELQIIFKCAE